MQGARCQVAGARLPLKTGRAGTMTHFDKRHGTTTLFAALDVATGTLLHDRMPHHRHQEFLKFMRWLARHPRAHFHLTPTSSSWRNLVERFFSELTERRLRRLAVTSVDQGIEAITPYIDRRNEHPAPFV